MILADITNELKSQFLILLAIADAAAFVRMSPSQKTTVIEIAQKCLGLRVMAIGDGYNDT